jgi:hypothetical protein
MSNSTGYSISVQPQVAVGQAATLTATLVGGSDLNAPLIVSPAGTGLSFAGPITIDRGSTSGATTFTPGAGDGFRWITATHSGGIPGMVDPSALFQAVSPTLPPMTGFDFSIASPPAGQSSIWTDHNAGYRLGPDGAGYLITAYPLGGWAVPGPTLVTFADDANGVFLPSWILIGGGDGTAKDGLDVVYYLPTAGGTRTITATVTGAKPGFSVPAAKMIQVVVPSPPSGSFTPARRPIAPPSMADFSLPVITPTYARATGYGVAIVSPPPGYQGVDSATNPTGCRTGPVGVPQFVYVSLVGGVALDNPLVVTLEDDAGGSFPGGPVTIAGGDFAHGFAVVSYIPMTAGMRTISATFTGGNSGFGDQSSSLLTQFLATS